LLRFSILAYSIAKRLREAWPADKRYLDTDNAGTFKDDFRHIAKKLNALK
jgi:hypothetical protein